jgi:hypothetical protein
MGVGGNRAGGEPDLEGIGRLERGNRFDGVLVAGGALFGQIAEPRRQRLGQQEKRVAGDGSVNIFLTPSIGNSMPCFRVTCGWPLACGGLACATKMRLVAVMCAAWKCGIPWPRALMGTEDRGLIIAAGSQCPDDTDRLLSIAGLTDIAITRVHPGKPSGRAALDRSGRRRRPRKFS